MKLTVLMIRRCTRAALLILVFGLGSTPGIAQSTYYEFFFPEIFFGRQPSARAEAMGRSGVAMEGELLCAYYNPAGIASLSGFSIATAFANPFYMLKNATYFYVSAGGKIGNIGSLSFSRYRFNWNDPFIMYDNWQNETGRIEPTQTQYVLSAAGDVMHGTSIGVSVGVLAYDPHLQGKPNQDKYRKEQTVSLDIGALHRITLRSNEWTQQHLTLGLSINNITGASLNYDARDNALPSLVRVGAVYKHIMRKSTSEFALNPFEGLLTIEYQDLLNGNVRHGFHTGMECRIYEIVAVRIGYYSERATAVLIGYPNKEFLSSFTWGFGLEFPIAKLVREDFPMMIRCDLTSLNQPLYTNEDVFHFKKFSSYTLQLSYRY